MVNIKRDIFLKYEFRYLDLHLFQYTLFSHPVKHNFLNLIFFKEKRNVTFHTVSLLFFQHPFLAVVLFKRKKTQILELYKKEKSCKFRDAFLTTQTKRNSILARHIILFFQSRGKEVVFKSPHEDPLPMEHYVASGNFLLGKCDSLFFSTQFKLQSEKTMETCQIPIIF